MNSLSPERVAGAGDLTHVQVNLRCLLQRQGFTWNSTPNDRQDIHAHGAPVVEIYGALEVQLEIWWKPYYNRGTAERSHQIFDSGDWLEVDALQCHFVHWAGEGMGAVFKARSGPWAEVGGLDMRVKTTREQCPCVKLPEVLKLLRKK